jgi:hypothetical protein
MYSGLPFAHDYLLPKARIDPDVAALIDAPSRPVDIGHPDRKMFDLSREPPQAEMNSPIHVVLQLGGELDSAR